MPKVLRSTGLAAVRCAAFPLPSFLALPPSQHCTLPISPSFRLQTVVYHLEGLWCLGHLVISPSHQTDLTGYPVKSLSLSGRLQGALCTSPTSRSHFQLSSLSLDLVYICDQQRTERRTEFGMSLMMPSSPSPRFALVPAHSQQPSM